MAYNYIERWARKSDFPWMADLPTMGTGELEREKNDCLDAIVGSWAYMRVHDYGPVEEFGWFECQHCGAKRNEGHSGKCPAGLAISRLRELGIDPAAGG